MKFTKLVATVAILAFAINANAYSDGTLRRGNVKVAQNDTPTTSKEVNININTNAAQSAQTQAESQAVEQPTTVVEAAPVVESKAEGMRKARQDAEVATEQKIVEKLEDSRLQEERARADRLFGNKLDAEKPAETPAPAPVVVAPAPTPAPAPVAEQKPAQVTIEKVEIIQPTPPPVVEKAEPVAETKAELNKEDDTEAKAKYYVSGLAGNLSYQASNVHSNYGLGVAVGTIMDEHVAIELSYFFSNHTVDDIYSGAIYHKMDQSDVSASAKYYLMTGKLKPYLGGSLTYINRKYQDRLIPYYGGSSWDLGNSQSTQAIDAGLLAGVDFAFNDRFTIGAGVDYNFNLMQINSLNDNRDNNYNGYNNYNNYNYSYGYGYSNLPNVQQLEKISYYGLKVNAKFTF